MGETSTSSVEITKTEWDSRKLSRYGNLMSLADTLHAVFYFGAIVGLLGLISASASGTISIVGYCVIGVLFVSLLKLLLKLSSPLNSYQTIIMRE